MGLVALLAAVLPTTALAGSASGPRVTVRIDDTTADPGSPVGVTFSATYRSPSGAFQPPAVRELLLRGPEGGQVDTAAPPRCAATDADLKSRGRAACPPGSVIGYGSARVKPLGLPEIAYRTTLFNAAGQQVELLEGDPPAPPSVVRGYFRADGTLASPIPTCLNGGYVPNDCSFDQVSLLSNTLVVPRYTRGGRSYFTTPPTCPSSRRWRSPSTFRFADATETLTPTQACHPARTRIAVAPRRVRRLARTRFRFQAEALLGGRWTRLSGALVRFAGRRARTNRQGRASIRLRFPALGRRRVRLSLAGYEGAQTRVRVANRRR